MIMYSGFTPSQSPPIFENLYSLAFWSSSIVIVTLFQDAGIARYFPYACILVERLVMNIIGMSLIVGKFNQGDLALQYQINDSLCSQDGPKLMIFPHSALGYWDNNLFPLWPYKVLMWRTQALFTGLTQCQHFPMQRFPY